MVNNDLITIDQILNSINLNNFSSVNKSRNIIKIINQIINKKRELIEYKIKNSYDIYLDNSGSNFNTSNNSNFDTFKDISGYSIMFTPINDITHLNIGVNINYLTNTHIKTYLDFKLIMEIGPDFSKNYIFNIGDSDIASGNRGVFSTTFNYIVDENILKSGNSYNLFKIYLQGKITSDYSYNDISSNLPQINFSENNGNEFSVIALNKYL